MIIIAALSERGRFIGKGNGMPWNVPDEYQQFLSFVQGQTVIIGRRSYEIFGRDLTQARNIVVSRSADAIPGATVCGSLEDAIEAAESYGKTVFFAGGASIYAQALPLADELFLSFIKGDFSGDVRFPEFDEKDWIVEERRDHPAYTFVRYRRTRAALDDSPY